MLVFCYFKSTSDQFGLNRGQLRGRDDYIGIHREHRLDVAINRETTDETPETVLVENIDQRRKVAGATVAYRFEDLSRGHDFFWSAPAERNGDADWSASVLACNRQN